MTVTLIPETRRAHWFRYLRFYYNRYNGWRWIHRLEGLGLYPLTTLLW